MWWEALSLPVVVLVFAKTILIIDGFAFLTSIQ
jgi:hypothetical protein